MPKAQKQRPKAVTLPILALNKRKVTHQSTSAEGRCPPRSGAKKFMLCTLSYTSAREACPSQSPCPCQAPFCTKCKKCITCTPKQPKRRADHRLAEGQTHGRRLPSEARQGGRCYTPEAQRPLGLRVPTKTAPRRGADTGPRRADGVESAAPAKKMTI